MAYARYIILVCIWSSALPAWARKTNNAVYEDPFDLGGGGASLTKASGAAQLFANPAVLPYGGTFHRWIGLDTWFIANKESVDTVQEIVGNSSGGSGEESDGEAESANSDLIDKVFKDPLHFGWGTSLSWVTNNGGLAVFSRFEPDVRARKRGDNGLPEISLTTESYHGAIGSLAFRSPFRSLSFGLSLKHIYASEQDIRIEVTDQESIAELRNPGFTQDLSSHGVGTGVDAGFLWFAQGRSVDWRLAGKVDDLGNTAFSGSSEPRAFKQVVSVGVSTTLHTGSDALQFSADYRDLLKAYDEELFKQVYLGTKLTLRTYVGLSAGYYNGYQSYGVEFDLILLRLAATYYTREFGDHPGVDPRRLYLISIAGGY